MVEKCKRCRELENELVLQNEILNAIMDITEDKDPSDFMMSFPIVREIWEKVQNAKEEKAD